MSFDLDLDALGFATGSLPPSGTYNSMSSLDARAQTVAHSAIAMSKPTSAEGYFEAQLEWGGQDSSLKWRIHGDTNVQDDRGNRMGIGIRQGSDGQGDISIKYENERSNKPSTNRK